MSHDDPMGTAALLKVLEGGTAAIDALLSPISARGQQMAAELEAAARRSVERADRAGAKTAAAVDFPRVAALVRNGAIADLTTREAKAAVRRFLEFEPALVGQLLSERPALVGVYGRQLFSDWERGHPQPRWKHDVALAEEYQAPLPVRVPQKPRDLLGTRGPELIAKLSTMGTLSETVDELTTRFALSPRWAFTHHAALHWCLAHARSRDATLRRIQELVVWEHRGTLLPIKRETGAIAGSTETKVVVVTELLAHLMDQKVEVPPALEMVLVDASFGDPRSVLSKEWEQVKAGARGGFEAFTLGLIREDLKFFFTHAMKEEDRAMFWLRYLPSIRRTICILDTGAFERVQNVSKGLDEKARFAARRAMRMNDLAVSAFCLVFDQYVAIEFSKKGNAGYVYDRTDFDRAILPASRTRPSLSDLKQQTRAKERLVHHGDWQQSFESTLSRLGIRPTRRDNFGANVSPRS